MKRKVVLAAAILSGLAASPLSANFHFMNIVQVFGGPPAAPNAQYVMLQMWTAGQNVVGGHQLTVYNGDGSLAATLTFPPSPGGDVANGANQATILIGTAEAQTFFGVTMDLLISPVSTTGQGLKICWAGTYDCVAIGDYTGSTTGVGLPFLMGDFSTLALTRRLDVCTGLGATPGLDQCDDTDNSATDFVLTLPSPRNNAGAVGTIPAATCGNNTLEGLEDCDDGDTESGDGCSNVCKYEPSRSSPQALGVDNNTNQSNGNGVLEPGEAVSVVPSWKNTDASAARPRRRRRGVHRTRRGDLYAENRPGPVRHDRPRRHPQLRRPPRSATSSRCRRPLTRPAATHWDATFDELLSGGGRRPGCSTSATASPTCRAATSSIAASRRSCTTASRPVARPRSTAPTTRSAATRWASSSGARSPRAAPTSPSAAPSARAPTTASPAASRSSPTSPRPTRPAGPSTTSPRRT